YNGYIELEEDFRACMYHNLRSLIDDSERLVMLLGHNVQFKTNTIKPDMIIFRDNYYLAAIELKIDGENSNDSRKSGLNDRKRIKSFKEHGIKRGYFIHIDKTDKNYTFKKQDWHNNYYHELFHIVHNQKTKHYHVSAGKRNYTDLHVETGLI
ncbi:MAG: hypothetical protein AB8B69_04945, partial [Chitinophagales bacterium]